jgi:hypothetical protein
VLVAVLLASLVAVPAGVIAAWRQNSLLDLAGRHGHAAAVDPDFLARPAAAAVLRPEARMAAGGRLRLDRRRTPAACCTW